MQDYKFVLRTLVSGNTVIDPQTGQIVVQNASEFMSYLNEQYLAQGYKVLSVETLRTLPAENGMPVRYERAYDLVKEIEEKAKK